MKRKAIQLYRQGYNCALCLLKAAEFRYGIIIPPKMMQGCSVINNGFGVGGLCSVLVVGVMIFGMLFDEKKAKQMRLKLFTRFHENHGNFHCSALSANDDKCESIIAEVADLVDQIIAEG